MRQQQQRDRAKEVRSVRDRNNYKTAASAAAAVVTTRISGKDGVSVVKKSGISSSSRNGAAFAAVIR